MTTRCCASKGCTATTYGRAHVLADVTPDARRGEVVALMGNPSTVLLDEPSEGLAPVIVEQMPKTIRDMKNKGLTILLSEQNLHFATLVADRAYVVEKGDIRYRGTMPDLAANEDIRKSYLISRFDAAARLRTLPVRLS